MFSTVPSLPHMEATSDYNPNEKSNSKNKMQQKGFQFFRIREHYWTQIKLKCSHPNCIFVFILKNAHFMT